MLVGCEGESSLSVMYHCTPVFPDPFSLNSKAGVHVNHSSPPSVPWHTE